MLCVAIYVHASAYICTSGIMFTPTLFLLLYSLTFKGVVLKVKVLGFPCFDQSIIRLSMIVFL